MNIDNIKKGIKLIKQGLFSHEHSNHNESFDNKRRLLAQITPNAIPNSLVLKDNYYKSTSLFSKREFEFYKRIKSILSPTYDVLFEVALSALIELNSKMPLTDKQKDILFKEYANKRLDFVIIDNLGNVFCVIELDDYSHQSEKAKKYDELKNNLLHSVNIPLIRISEYHNLTQEQLFKKLFSIKGNI